MIPTIRPLAPSLFSLAAIFTGLTAARAQDSANFETSVRAAMASSIDKQRTSVERQTVSSIGTNGSARPPSFFVLPIASDNISALECEPVSGETSEPAADRADPQDPVDSGLVAIGTTGKLCEASPSEAAGPEESQPVPQEEVEAQNPVSPEADADVGTKLLRLFLEQYTDNVPLGLAPYHQGVGRMGASDGVPQIPAALNYVADIVRKMSQKDERKTAPYFPIDLADHGP